MQETNHTSDDATATSEVNIAPSPESTGKPEVLETATHTPPEAETDADSPLDNANFLSFEDWKKQNLEKAGQSPDHVGSGRGSAAGAATERKRPDVGSLESLGEEGEIDFDFGGFVGMDKPAGTLPAGAGLGDATRPAGDETSEASQIPTYMRSKDAGKTCKERYNYASFDCAATVLKTNPQCKSATSVLVENKDSYMLNECAAANKFLIMELCDDIIVDTVVLANFEFFSSMVRTFKVSVSDRYPPKPGQWIELGTFEARNSREIQAFLVEGPRVWARYLRLEFLTHYGNEYYCPVSLLRVHGITMMEEYKHEEERARGEVEQQDQGIEEAAGGPEKVVTAEAVVLQEAASAATSSPNTTESTTNSISHPTPVSSTNESTTDAVVDATLDAERSPPGSSISTKSDPGRSISGSEVVSGSRTTNKSVKDPSTSTVLNASNDPKTNVTQDANHIASDTNSAKTIEASTNLSSNVVAPEDTPQMQNGTSTNLNAETPITPTSTNTSVPVHSTNSTGNSTMVGTTSSSTTVPEKSKPVASVAVQPAAPSPSTQESFFKSVDKRLKALESNATLSLQYIEEQSRILRDAFTKVEKRQLTKTETFLDHLNTTVITELKTFRMQYDQLWQSTVIELETHREQYQHEILAISSRLSLLADEVVFQKRMAVVQSTLLMLCLGFVLFVRSGTSNLELPLVQSMMNRSQKMRATVPFDSPMGSPRRPSSPESGPHSERRSGLARLFKRPGSRGSGSPAGVPKPVVEISSPTPVEGSPNIIRHSLRRNGSSDSLIEENIREAPPASTDDEEDEDNEFSPEEEDSNSEDVSPVRPKPRHIRSGPATPQGTRDNPLDWEPAPSSLVNGSSDSSEPVLVDDDPEREVA